MSEKSFTRRSVAIAGGIAAALGLTALGLTAPRLFGRRYAATPYDDLLDQLADRDAAKRVGYAIIGTATFNAHEAAGDLRKHFAGRTLAQVTASDIAGGHLIEARGWVLPESLGLLCALAADPT